MTNGRWAKLVRMALGQFGGAEPANWPVVFIVEQPPTVIERYFVAVAQGLVFQKMKRGELERRIVFNVHGYCTQSPILDAFHELVINRHPTRLKGHTVTCALASTLITVACVIFPTQLFRLHRIEVILSKTKSLVM